MKSRNSFDKSGLIMGLCTIFVGFFVDPQVMILGSIMAMSGILAYLVECYKSKRNMSEEVAEEVFFSEVVQKASEIPIR